MGRCSSYECWTMSDKYLLLFTPLISLAWVQSSEYSIWTPVSIWGQSTEYSIPGRRRRRRRSPGELKFPIAQNGRIVEFTKTNKMTAFTTGFYLITNFRSLIRSIC